MSEKLVKITIKKPSVNQGEYCVSKKAEEDNKASKPRHSAKVQTDPDTDESYIDIHDMLKNTDVKADDVCYYIITNKGEGIGVTLFDKDKKEIFVKEKDEEAN